jgi:hypothetical protein
MKAELKYLHSPDVKDLKNYLPKEPDNFCILIQAMIGSSVNENGESFDFIVCTPKWLETQIAKDNFVIGRGYIVVKEFNYNLIREVIQNLCDKVSGNDWNTIANKISRYGYWEFEDYQSS